MADQYFIGDGNAGVANAGPLPRVGGVTSQAGVAWIGGPETGLNIGDAGWHVAAESAQYSAIIALVQILGLRCELHVIGHSLSKMTYPIRLFTLSGSTRDSCPCIESTTFWAHNLSSTKN